MAGRSTQQLPTVDANDESLGSLPGSYVQMITGSLDLPRGVVIRWAQQPDKEGRKALLVFWDENFSGDCHEVTKGMVRFLHDHVIKEDKDFVLIWFQSGNHKIGPKHLAWLFWNLPKQYLQHLQACHVVHPSWTVRLAQFSLFPWNYLSDDFAETRFIGPVVKFANRFRMVNWSLALYNVLYVHERLEFLEPELGGDPVQLLSIPESFVAFDKDLDRQAEIDMQNAQNQMGMPTMGNAGIGGQAGAGGDLRQRSGAQ